MVDVSGNRPPLTSDNAEHTLDHPGLPLPRRIFAVAVLLMMIVALVGGANAVAIGLPRISAELAIPAADAIWLQNAYQIVVIVAILPCATLGERIGHRLVFRLGLASMVAGSGLVLVWPQFMPLIGSRMLQGLGAALVMSVSPAILRDIYPSSRLGLAISINAVGVAVSAALGPIAGSLILEAAPWQALFGLFMPVSLLGLAMSALLPTDEKICRAFDLRGALLNGLVAGAGMGAMSIAERYPSLALVLLIAAVAAGIALVLHVRRVTTPFLPLDLLLKRGLGFAYLASTLNFAINAMTVISLPFLLIESFGMGIISAGRMMAFWSVAVAGSVVATGLLSDRFPAEPLCLFGAAAVATGLALLTGATFIWPTELSAIGIVVAGIGFGSFQAANNRILIAAAPRHRRAVAGGLQAMVREVGNGLGFGIAGLSFAFWRGHEPEGTLALALAMAVSAVMLNITRLSDPPMRRW